MSVNHLEDQTEILIRPDQTINSAVIGTKKGDLKPKKEKLSKQARREELTGYLYISPWIIGFLCFGAFPIISSLLLSFSKWDIYKPPTWVGFYNFARLLNDPLFYKSMKVTLTYSILSIPLSLIIGLGLSLLLNLKIKGIEFFRTLFYIPSVITGVAVAMLWKWILNDGYGLINYGLSLIGIQGPQWLLDPKWIVPSFVIIGLWGVGGNAILFLGGLQNIPSTLYESATMDGAKRFQKFRKITLPLLTPTLFFLLLMGIVGSFQVFTVAYIVNGAGSMGGPENSGLFYMVYLYQKAFKDYDIGYASAMAWVGGVISFILSFLVYRTQKKWVYYEADPR